MADEAVIWNAVSVVIGGAVGALGGWMAKRVEKAPDIQETLSKAVAGVVSHYTAALTRADAEVEDRRREAQALRDDVADLRRLVEGQTRKLEEQSSEIEGLVAHIERLEASITDLGGKPPARRPRKIKSETIG